LTTPPQTRPSDIARKNPISLWLLAILLFISYVGYASRLGALGLTGPDEPRYASIARNMAETGDYVTPRLNGQPWFEKPILYYWTAAISFRILGESDYAARFPSALAAMLATLAIAWAAWRFYSAATTVLVLLLMPTTMGVIGFSHSADPDMLFAGTVAVVMAFGAEIVIAEKPRILHCIGLGIFLALAVLAKGPAAIVLLAGSVGLWGVFSGQFRRALRVAHPAGVAAFLIVAVPWYALCSARNPNFLRIFIWMHNFKRYTTNQFHHVQPWWFYVPVVVCGLLPWTGMALAAGRDMFETLRSGEWKISPGLYFGCWAGFTFLFFTISQSKLPGYLLPALPAFVIPLADAGAKMIRRRDAISRWSCVLLGGAWLVLVTAGLVLVQQMPANSPMAQPALWRWWMLAGAVGGIAIMAMGWGGRIAGAILLNALLVAGLFEAANWKVMPVINQSLSSRPTAQVAIAAGLPQGNFYAFQLNRDWQFGLEYYLRRPLPDFPDDAAAAKQVVAAGSTYVFTTEEGCAQLAMLGETCSPMEQTTPNAWLVRVAPKPQP
jgi:4-amino-4-deoxy-L-arabinose transferase-like glycosyltransferase